MASYGASLEPAPRRKQIPHLTTKLNSVNRQPILSTTQAKNETLRKTPIAPSSSPSTRESASVGQNLPPGKIPGTKITLHNGRKISSRTLESPTSTLSRIPLQQGGMETQPRRKDITSSAGKSFQTPVLLIPTNGVSRTNTLRRKPSLINTYVSQTRQTGGIQPPIFETGVKPNTNSLLSVPQPPLSASSSITEFEDGDAIDEPSFTVTSLETPYADTLLPFTVPPPPSITPSTRYSESPGAFSHVTTPTSMSSYSSNVTSSPATKSTILGMSPGNSSRYTSQTTSSTSGQNRTYPPLKYDQNRSKDGRTLYTTARTNSPVQIDGLPRRTIPRSVPSTYPPQSQKAAENLSGHQWTSKAPSSKLKNPLVFPPPELAHLMESPIRPQISEIAPRRPSRDGTSSLLDEQRTSPVIHSKLPALRSPFTDHKRRLSNDQDSDAGSTASGSPRRSQNMAPSEIDIVKPASSPAPRSTLRKPKPSIPEPQSKPGPRFGFFSRKPKPETGGLESDSVKAVKKGPRAGTGHEGYGKYATRRRSGGLAIGMPTIAQLPLKGDTDIPDCGRKSTSSGRSEADIEKDLHDRPPIVRNGIESTDENNKISIKATGSTSSQNTFDGLSPVGSSIGSPKTFRTSNSSAETHGFNSGISLFPNSSNAKAGPKAPSVENSDSDASNTSSRIPARKGFFSSRSIGKSATQKGIRGPSSTNLLASRTALVNNDQSNTFGSTMPMPESHGLSNSRRGNWSLFSKSRTAPKSRHIGSASRRDQSPETFAVEQVPAAVEPDISMKSIAHYAILESHDQISIADLNEILQEADASHDEDDFEDADESSRSLIQNHSVTQENPEAPVVAPFSSSTSLSASNATESPVISQSPADSGFAESKELHNPSIPDGNIPRPSRLLQVGRIPKVVSKRDRIRTLPDRSFSRPFAKTQPMPSLSKAKISDFGSLTPDDIVPLSSPDDSNLKSMEDDKAAGVVQNEQPLSKSTDNSVEEEFISFPARKNSDLSYSSSSGTMRFPSSLGLASDTGTPLSEDEVWQEYDDLLDDILTPTSSNTMVRPQSSEAPERASTVRSRSTSEVSPPENDMESTLLDPYALRRSRLLAVLQPESSLNVAPAGSVTESEEFNRDVVSKRRSSLPKAIQASINTTRSSQSSDLRASMIARNFNNTHIVETKSKRTSPNGRGQNRPESSANLRFGALMVSKWLSFGRVLFSPAHFEVLKSPSERILVIDGLGKDWSYWCALTYSDSEIYNLGPPPVENSSKREIGGFKSLPNHQYISHTMPDDPFPFEKGFFAAVIYRFPVISTEAGYRFVVSECKRVLKPGGFLEISMLDLDLNCMGNRARRAVRHVKTKLQESNSGVCLQPPDDIMIRLLGSRGFENLNRCMVGLPAAGVVSDSRENSIDKGKKNLADLVKDESKEGDDNITKMVAKVGRWWYTRCFEKSLLLSHNYNGSIWNDTDLLKECEALETNLKLLICYAQKPLINKRRTVSL